MIVRCGTQEVETRGQNGRREGESTEPKVVPKYSAPRTIKLTSKFFADAMLVAVGDYIERTLPALPVLPQAFAEPTS
jgi:hypothetical protein